MQDDHWDRAKALFDRALAADEAGRARLIAGIDDPALRAFVVSLLEAHEHDSLMDSPVDADDPSSLAPFIPRVIGPFRIVRVLGMGGMGVVYLAEQEHPSRQVALKSIRAGMTSEATLGRFAQETRILGQLEHEGIARLYEAGLHETPAGRRPWFAMEYVRGRDLARYAREEQLDVDARLRLIRAVANAVSFANDRDVIHRDLKPGNILVDDAGHPKILDFGVARVTNADLAVTSLRTDVGQLVGTLAYMSPEQLDGSGDIDARCDVYSLGVVTYELLAGRLPIDVRERTVVNAAVQIREEEPDPLHSVDTKFRGDLSAIVAKAIEKRRDDRYASVAHFAADIDRFLNHEPITARRIGTWYQMRKFARRQRALVTAAAIAFLGLAIGVVVAVIWAVKAGEAERRAIADAKRAQASATEASVFNEYLLQLFAKGNPEGKQGRPLTLAALLARAEAGIADELAAYPRAEIRLRTAMAFTCHGIGDGAAAVRHHRRIVDLSRAVHGAGTELGIALFHLGDALRHAGLHAEALDAWRESESLLHAAGAAKAHADVLAAQGEAARVRGAYREAEEKLNRALELFGARGHRDESTILAHYRRGKLYRTTGRNEAARADLEAALAMCEALPASGRRTKASILNDLGLLSRHLGRLDDAVDYYRRSLALRRAIYGREPHAAVALGHQNLAAALSRVSRFDEARTHYERSLAMFEALGNATHVARAQSGFADYLIARGDLATATELLDAAMPTLRARFGDESPRLRTHLHRTARLFAAKGQHDRAIEPARRALAFLVAAVGAESPRTAALRRLLARSLLASGDAKGAHAELAVVVRILETRHGDGAHPDVAEARAELAAAARAVSSGRADRPR